jgi:RimJ/RimL family protein N-acetyltransferase
VTRIAGRTVILRSFRDDELERLLAVAAIWPVDDGIHWAPRDRESMLEKIRTSGTWTPQGQIDLAVEAGGRLVGDVQARSIRGAMPPGVFELGVEIFDRPDRGRGFGAAAIVELTDHLFREEGAHRVQLSTDVSNDAMRAVAERLGFGFEGVMRRFMPTAEGPHDYAMYAVTDDGWAEVMDRWISTS